MAMLSLLRLPIVPIVLLWLSLFSGATTAQDLTSQEFSDLVNSGQVDLILDVRSRTEWNQGHIPGATLAESLNLQLTSTPALLVNLTLIEDFDIFTCLHCRVVVYSQNGQRATQTINLLRDKGGFIGATLFNGQGTQQWREAGYPLVDTPSFVAPCMTAPVNGNRPAYCAGAVTFPPTTGVTTPAPVTPAPAPAPGTSPPVTPPDTTPPVTAPTTTPPVTTRPPTTPPVTSTPPPVTAPGPAPVGPPQKKEAPPAKCGSIAGDNGRGGAAAQAKDCTRDGGTRRYKLRGL